jgi:hypothetical protein
MPETMISMSKVVTLLIPVLLGATGGALATYVSFTNRINTLETSILNRAQVREIIEDITPWLRDKQAVLNKLEGLEDKQAATEVAVGKLTVQQSRVEVLLDKVGEDVQLILSRLE